MQFEAIVFDLDGTLVDSLADLADAMNCVLRSNGFPEHPTDRYRHFIGNGFEPLVRRALPGGRRDHKTVSRCVAGLEDAYRQRRVARTRPYAGVSQLLERCTAAGLKTAVLTNKPHGPAAELVALLMPDAPFRCVWGSRPEYPKKPDPTAALHLAEQLAVRPAQCIFLGDSAVDMETAQRAGMYAMGALWGFREADELIAAGARMLLRAPADLLAWL